MDTIITKRPEGMSFTAYVNVRSEQTKRERSRKKHGVLVYVASQLYKEPFTGVQMKRTFMPAIKTYDRHGNVKYVPMKRIEL